ncbi:hypothetical protein GCM10010433_14990 [Streptomyces pulveraceus]
MLTPDSFGHPAAQRAAPGPYDVPEVREVIRATVRDIRHDGTDGTGDTRRDGARDARRGESRDTRCEDLRDTRRDGVGDARCGGLRAPERDEVRSAPVPRRVPAGVAS